ncbi:MAG TPA: ATP-binding protein, partial [Opitutaceae bacterium]|nr:ATP-binding protein [Opitutaceae bacterium]
FAVLLYYSGTAYAITTFRIFNARELLMAGLAKASLVIAVAGVAFAADQLFVNIMAQPFTLLATAAVALAFAAVANEWLGRVFRYYPQAMAARQAALSIVQKETRIDRMVTGFSGVLKSWGHTEQALIAIVPRGDFLKLGELGQEANGAIVQVLRELQWATPERLARERYTPARGELKTYLAQHTLGGVVLTEGPAVTAIFGIGMSASRRPYTFPQMVQLMELASIMESAFERAHLSVKVQHAEQLATVGLLGASLAHEIRNPLVSIKTFVQLLPAHYQEPAFREKFFKLLGDEVDRIDHLTEQLLDLAAPRTYAATTVELHPILRASMDLVATKAAHRNVQLIADFEAKPDTVFTDAAAAKQVILNLCFNAIQALENQDERQRCVWIKTRQNGGGIEVAVSDSGPGISPEILPRLFQPFQTTKSSGFGLGLAICRDILANLNASISIDPPQPGHGATFRVNFPCQPSLS